MYEHTHAMQQ